MANNLYNYPSGMSSSIPTYNYDPSLTSSSGYSTGDPARYGRTASSSSAVQSGIGAEVGVNGGVGTGMGVHSLFSWGGAGGGASFTDAMLVEEIKRRNEALYHQSALGTHNSIGQSEAIFSTNSLVNRPRIETASHLPIYPQRPLEKDCAHYMLTRTCKFGDTCKFNHPIWVPVGGMPNWNEVPLPPLNECLPERPGEPDCLYFMRTQKCKFGNTCRFNHPKDNLKAETADASAFPERPHEPICSYYAKTGNCMFGVHCIYNHPKDLQIPGFSVSPASLHNTKGLPIRPGEPHCPFYIRTGSCKYGATCRYSHPEWNGQTIYQPLSNMNLSASLIPNTDPGLAQTDQGMTIYPQRPGKAVCHFYMKTGQCKFAVTCKFHHPPNWTAPKEDVELTAAGLPRREGSIMCPFYMKTSHCMYGATCRYDHPPVEEATVIPASDDATTEANAHQ